MSMRIFRIQSLILFTILFVSNISHSQVTYSEFLNEEDIHRKTEMGLELWNVYLRSDMDSLKVVAVELLMDASEKENEFARAVGTRILGSHLYRSGKIDQGLEYMIASKEYFEKNEDFITSSELYNEVGHALLLKGEFDEAIVAYRKSIQYGKKSTDPTAEFNAELGMGKAFVALGDTNIGMEMILHYKDLALENKKYEAVADALASLGQIETDRNNTSLANDYYYQSLAYSKKSKSKIHLSHAYANMGILKYTNSDYDSSLYYFGESLNLRVKLNNIKGIIEGYYNLGDYFGGLDQLEKSVENFSKSREMSSKNGFIPDEIDAITEMIHIYKKMGDFNRVKSLTKDKERLLLKMEEQEGIDQEIIKSIDLNFSGNKNSEIIKEDEGIGWIGLTVFILIAGLVAFFVSERRRIS